MPMVDLTAKVEYLCRAARISTVNFIDEISDPIREKFERLDKRTAESFFNSAKSHGISRLPVHKVIRYFNTKLAMQLELLRCGFESSDYETFRAEIDEQRQQTTRTIPLSFDDSLDVITGAELEYICGKYALYRRSFSNFTDVVKEIAMISRNASSQSYLDINMYCHPSVRSKQRGADGRIDDAVGDVEWFKGVVFKFGRMYSAIASYKSAALERRIRYLHFPVLDARLPVHYGLVTGYSAYHQEPAAARIVAVKVGGESALSGDDKREVKRGDPNDLKDPDRPTVPSYVLDLIENNIDLEKEKRAAVLISHKGDVPRL